MQFEMVMIILLVAIGFMIYYYLTDMSHKFENNNEKIVDTVDGRFEDFENKIIEMNESMHKKMFECNKKVQDLYSLQHKMHEVDKINAQTTNMQFRYYDDNIGNSQAEHMINSAENSCSPPVNMNGVYFIASTMLNQTRKGWENDEPYMSSNGEECDGDKVIELQQQGLENDGKFTIENNNKHVVIEQPVVEEVKQIAEIDK